MEANQFVEWFDKVFIHETKHLESGKLLIFDGHNSHLTKEVVDLALANNIELLCLPAHTSSVLQPLDVGVFKTVKAVWRSSLKKYYDETRYRNVDKIAFPKLLKTVIELGAFSRSNAIYAFEACGIFPINRQKIVAEKLSTSQPLITGVNMSSTDDSATVSSLSVVASSTPVTPNHSVPSSVNVTGAEIVSLTPRRHNEAALLKHLRSTATKEVDTKRKRVRRTLAECLTATETIARLAESESEKNAKKCGKSKIKNQNQFCAKRSSEDIEVNNPCDLEGDAQVLPGPFHRTELTEISESSESDCNMELDDDSDDSIKDASKAALIADVKKGRHVAVVYDGKWYPAKIEKRLDDDISVQFMEIKGTKKFRWPEREDHLIVPLDDVLCIVDAPTSVSKRHQALSSYDFNAANVAFNKRE